MKTLLTALFLVAGLAVFPAAAESPLVVNIPFDFYAADQFLPAGEYTIEPLSASTVNITLLRAVKSGEKVTAANRPRYGWSKGKTCVVFNQYSGERYFLSQTWVEGDRMGRELLKTQRERQVVTSTLITGLKPETVTLLARVK